MSEEKTSKGFSVGAAEVTAFMKVANDAKILFETYKDMKIEPPAKLYPYPIGIEDCFAYIRLSVHEDKNMAIVLASDKNGRFHIMKTPWDKLKVLELKNNPTSYIKVAAGNLKVSLQELWKVLAIQNN